MRASLPTLLLAGFQPYLEKAFSKIKGMVRQAGARTREALVEVLGEALSAVSVEDARGNFQHAGYCPRANYCETCCIPRIQTE
jgi:hypothetical protein